MEEDPASWRALWGDVSEIIYGQNHPRQEKDGKETPPEMTGPTHNIRCITVTSLTAVKSKNNKNAYSTLLTFLWHMQIAQKLPPLTT